MSEHYFEMDEHSRQQMMADDYLAEQAVAEHDAYCNQKIDAHCECCRMRDHGTQEALKGRGWLLLGNEQFCEFHGF